MIAKSLVVLCVEDDGDNAMIVRLSLALDPGLDVRSAASGEQALALLDDGLRPDIVMLDVRLPGISGIDVARAIATCFPELSTRIIFMTAGVRAKDIGEMRQVGACDIIAKPFDPLTLANVCAMRQVAADRPRMHPKWTLSVHWDNL